ncbi:MAG: hypothetical protein J7L07_08820 [Candidatus Odinarchaeota archaeon]|nr:hypothetical protein [Candidatus Odinarchaeota archaeon]
MSITSKKTLLIVLISFLLLSLASVNENAAAVEVGDRYIYDSIYMTKTSFNNTEPVIFTMSSRVMINVTAMNETSGIINYTVSQTMFLPSVTKGSFNTSESYIKIQGYAMDLDGDEYYDSINIAVVYLGFICKNMTKNVEEMNRTLNSFIENYTLFTLLRKDFNTDNRTFTVRLKAPVEKNILIHSSFENYQGFAYITLKVILTEDYVIDTCLVYIGMDLTSPTHGTVRYEEILLDQLYREAPPSMFSLENLEEFLKEASLVILGGVAIISLIIGVLIGKKL